MKALFFAGIFAVLAATSPGRAEPQKRSDTEFVLTASSDLRSYGVWVAAPEKGCRVVRYTVASAGRTLGHSPPLRPGDGALIRIGRGFSVGVHLLDVIGIGCDAAPAEARRVLLGKTSPDHSWLWR
jgi:hypothetical protein